eukprot:COSAG02_NODE_68176_length_251_cov_0.677632_1_plen_83_part_11
MRTHARACMHDASQRRARTLAVRAGMEPASRVTENRALSGAVYMIESIDRGGLAGGVDDPERSVSALCVQRLIAAASNRVPEG